MTPTRSGSNYPIQSNGSVPGHSSQKCKRQECQPRGEAQMEDSRASTSSQRLVNTFETLLESSEACITAIPVFRPESFPTGSNRDIPVSVQELLYGGKEDEWELLPSLCIGTMSSYLQVKNFKGPEKTEELLRGWTPMSFKGQVQQIQAWFKSQSMLSEDQKKKFARGKYNSTMESPQAPTSAKQGQAHSKEQSEGQAKGKGKHKMQVAQALPTEL
ncbi:hypothetical protein O181_043104 [Austropuccinia psidii MF-1]|uniref:Uncharacterized protein n=1 Tax=Austropuccinia psidii MF-1 TaxID=1389203 RepID=A0A9Q3DHC9_9BASI|nr:hypothetical protein [Austropuccinia psidii MF-1]